MSLWTKIRDTITAPARLLTGDFDSFSGSKSVPLPPNALPVAGQTYTPEELKTGYSKATSPEVKKQWEKTYGSQVQMPSLQELQAGATLPTNIAGEQQMITPFRQLPTVQKMGTYVTPEGLTKSIAEQRGRLETQKKEGISEAELTRQQRGIGKQVSGAFDIAQQRLAQLGFKTGVEQGKTSAFMKGAAGEIADVASQRQAELDQQIETKRTEAFEKLMALEGTEADIKMAGERENITRAMYNNEIENMLYNVDESQLKSWNELVKFNKLIETGQATGTALADMTQNASLAAANASYNNAITQSVTGLMSNYMMYRMYNPSSGGGTTSGIRESGNNVPYTGVGTTF